MISVCLEYVGCDLEFGDLGSKAVSFGSKANPSVSFLGSFVFKLFGALFVACDLVAKL